jgi:hypothetical protein
VSLDELRIVAVGNEADFLAVRLVSYRKAPLARVRANLGLREPSNREDRRLQLLLRQRKQEIRLVLARIAPAKQAAPPSLRIVRKLRVVPSPNGGRIEAGCAIDQRRKLQVAVAVRTGDRRSTKFEMTVSWNWRSRFRM